MAQTIQKPFLVQFTSKILRSKTIQKSKKQLVLDKRQKFSIGVGVLSLGILFAEISFNGYGIVLSCLLGVFADLVLFWAIHKDLEGNHSFQTFLLPLLYSISFGLFSFLTPARILIRSIILILFAVGLYSVFLSENIFIVASIRTIALLHSARIISLIISLITYFFLISTILSFHAGILPTIALMMFFSFLLSSHAIWTYTLNNSLKTDILWVILLTISPLEVATLLWFWPTTPVVEALFLTSMWYILVGLSHVWLDKRLFRNVLWEYMWVGVIAFFILLSFTKWQ